MNTSIPKQKIFTGIALVAGAIFAIMAILGAPGNAFAITGVVVGLLYAAVAVFWPSPADHS